MEFSSSYVGILDLMVSERDALLVAFIFGVMGVAFVVFILMALLKRFGAHQFIINLFLLLGSTLFICLFAGLIVLMPLFFMGVSGLKMLLIWIIMFLMIFSFLIYQFKVIGAKIKKVMN
ncbi:MULTISPECIES: hypothetical protein [Flavobacterium]|uniref:DUF4870 domain-containing protein n=1 Tax=Flavobacterium hankyongi TaxID=1176532 RepID=A0ABP8ZK50_9FLAO|nr:hypothetical protein [Flavobacterium sp. N1846]